MSYPLVQPLVVQTPVPQSYPRAAAPRRQYKSYSTRSGPQSFRRHHHHRWALQRTARNAFIAGMKKANPNYRKPLALPQPQDLTKMSDDQLAQLVSLANQVNELKANQALKNMQISS